MDQPEPTPARRPQRHSWRRLARGVLVGLAALALVAGLVELRAPQLLVLASEGFPGATWPASGDFALVEGAEVPADPAPGASPPEAALVRLAASNGRALLMERGGVLLAEAYGPGLGRDTPLNSYSMVKSLVGALTLRAIADGHIAGLDVALRDLLGPEAPDVTVGEALAMRSGLVLPAEPPKTGAVPLDDAGFSPLGPLARLHAYGIEAVMGDMRVDKGMRGELHYQSANTALLGLAVERAYGRPLPELLSEMIWAPAGAADAHWRRTPGGGDVSAYCCLYARPLDWLKVSRFLLDNGTPGAPFLPDTLWHAFLLPDLDPEARRAGAYGLHLRHDVLDREGEALHGSFAYFMGLRGQVVYLLPEQDLVVVRFGGEAQLLHSTLYELAPASPARTLTAPE